MTKRDSDSKAQYRMYSWKNVINSLKSVIDKHRISLSIRERFPNDRLLMSKTAIGAEEEELVLKWDEHDYSDNFFRVSVQDNCHISA